MSDALRSSDPFQPYVDDRESVETRWPTVIGILCTVYGAIGTLFYLFATLVLVFEGPISRLSGRPPSTPPEMKAITLAQSVVLLALGVALVYGGIQLVRRRARGHRVVLGWAVARLACALVQLAVGFATIDMTAKAQVAQYQRQMDSMNETERKAVRDFMKSIGSEEPTVESVHASAPKFLAITTIGFSAWPLVVAIMLTGRRCRTHAGEWARREAEERASA
ncbi:MAG: hypothetical protein ACKO0W_00100 [Planctomycetota bacterium]